MFRRIATMKLGDKIMRKITMMPPDKNDEPYEGTVVYIHPKNRFFTLEFDLPGGKVHESYQITECEEIGA